tara:strand:+ start:283 stop:1650 length:1368 start_codon:yes stop_codon:yes gene_type:complete
MWIFSQTKQRAAITTASNTLSTSNGMNRALAFLCGLFLSPVLFAGVQFTHAQSEVQKLQNQIEQKNDRLASIEKEIKEYEAALREVGAERSTLQGAINSLVTERKKVQADIRYTENKINSTDLQIDQLTLEIRNTEDDIAQNERAISAILRQMNTADHESLVEILLRQDNISAFWNEYEALEQIKQGMFIKIATLNELKETYESKRAENESFRGELLELKDQYSDQNAVLLSNQAEKDKLLSVTKNEEANYQTLLSQKKAAWDQLVSEVQDIESQIQFILDPNTIPKPGTPVFRWPLDNPYITQYFGYTKFALSGAYGGNQHNGMDMGTAVGTKVYAPLTGTVRNVGNTDEVPGCYSWGKWILIDHPNGLSSMFSHLSQISVTPGQKVTTGEIIGYSGNSGYSTGPHLHYTVYVSDGVEVKQFNQYKKVTGCGAALSPFAAIEAYMDPLDFLPPL